MVRADAALLDEARALLGPASPARNGDGPTDDDEIRTYGHIVIDEVQDLTPMQLRMAARRSLNGSMTVVGDIAQATGPHAPRDWNDVLRPPPRPPAGPGHRAHRRLPHPGPDHGAGGPGPAGRRAGAAAAHLGPRGRAPARDRPGRRRRPRPGHRRRRRPCSSTGSARAASPWWSRRRSWPRPRPRCGEAGVRLRPGRPHRARRAASTSCRSAW